MAFTFPLNPVQNQIAVTPLGQRYIYMSADEGWRSVGAARSPAETVGVTIGTTMFFIGNPVNIGFTTAAVLPSSGVNPPFSFPLASGRLPTGLSLNSNGGFITGTPTVAFESYSFVISVLDSAGFLVNSIVFNGQVSGLVTTNYLASIGEVTLANIPGPAGPIGLTGATGPTGPTGPTIDLSGLSPAQLTALASAIIAAAPAAALSAALTTMIETLPTDASSTGRTLWNNGGTPQYT